MATRRLSQEYTPSQFHLQNLIVGGLDQVEKKKPRIGRNLSTQIRPTNHLALSSDLRMLIQSMSLQSKLYLDSSYNRLNEQNHPR